MSNILKSRWARALFSFGSMHAMRLGLPLLAFPWLGRALGQEAFGLLMYMCLFPPILALVIDWGFPLGATRLAAANRGKPEKLGQLLREVLLARLLLALACLGLCALAAPFLPHVAEYPLPFCIALCAGLARGSSPVWFFQGVNSGLRELALWDISSSLAVFALTVCLARDAADWPLYLALYALCKGAAWLLLTLRLLRAHPGGWNMALALKLIGECRSLFFGLALADVYHYFSQLACGFFLGPAQLGVLLALSKILRAMSSLVLPFTQTIFPEICLLGKSSPAKSRHILRISLFGTAGGMCLACLIAWPLSPLLLRLALGDSFTHNVAILHLLLLAAPVASVNAVLAFQVLAPYGHDQAQALARAAMALASVPLALVLTSMAGLYGAALVPLCAETCLLLALAGQILRLCPQALLSRA